MGAKRRSSFSQKVALSKVLKQLKELEAMHPGKPLKVFYEALKGKYDPALAMHIVNLPNADFYLKSSDNITGPIPRGKGLYGPASPLELAASIGRADVLALLLQKGTYPNLGPSLSMAASGGRLACVALLADRIPNIDEWTDPHGRTALHCACWNGHAEVAECLIDRGAKFVPDHNYCETPLHYAIQSCKTKVVRLLIAKGADLEVADDMGRTPLCLAVSWNQSASIKALLEAGAKVNSVSQSPLHTAVTGEWASPANQAKILLEYGAALDLPCDEGLTPLIAAMMNGTAKAVKTLLDNGADVPLFKSGKPEPFILSQYSSIKKKIYMLLKAEGRLPPLVWERNLTKVERKEIQKRFSWQLKEESGRNKLAWKAKWKPSSLKQNVINSESNKVSDVESEDNTEEDENDKSSIDSNTDEGYSDEEEGVANCQVDTRPFYNEDSDGDYNDDESEAEEEKEEQEEEFDDDDDDDDDDDESS